MAVLLRVFFCILLLYINADFFVIIYESIIYSVYILETHVSRDDNDNDIMKNLKESGNCFLLRLTRDTHPVLYMADAIIMVLTRS